MFRLNYFLLTTYLALLFPLAIYFLILFQLNRRNNPVMVSGVWDSIGLLFAGSGFLLISGPLFIGWKFEVSLADWTVVWIAYYLLILAGSALLLWSRRHVTVIYNVDADMLNQLLERVLDKIGVNQTRIGHAVMIGPPLDIAAEEATSEAITEMPGRGREPRDSSLLKRYPLFSPPEENQDRLDVEPFPAMCNVTLHWRSGTLALRQEVEDELRRNLDECRSLDNPSAGWFLGLSSLLFMFIMFAVALAYVLRP